MSPGAPLPKNRLTIAHLLLWTLGSSIILACYRAWITQNQLPADSFAIMPLLHLVYSLALGAQVGSVFLWALRALTRQSGFPTEPGHWLLLIEGFSALAMWAGCG